MLHKNVILLEVLFLIEELADIPLIRDYRLVGGTALALQKGHRFSDDIDLFSVLPIDSTPRLFIQHDWEEIKNDLKTKLSQLFRLS